MPSVTYSASFRTLYNLLGGADGVGLRKNAFNIIADVMNLKFFGECISCFNIVWYMTHYCTYEKKIFLKQRYNSSNIERIINHKADPGGWVV